MSARRERAELKESLKQLQRNDLEDVVKVQQYVIGVTMGRHPFEHPGSPRIAPGSRYMPNQTEIDFTQRSRSTLYSNFFRYIAVGALTPYATLRVLSIMQKRIIPVQRYMIWSSLGGGLGGMYGMTLGRVSVARDYLRLENSPLATEARYQLWKINPQHPFLSGFEHETVEWNQYQYRDPRNTFDDEYEDDMYTDYKERKPMRPPPASSRIDNKNRDRNMEEEDMDFDENVMRRKKRDRFYQGRNRVDSKRFDDRDHDDIGEFFDQSHGDDDEFFDADSKQKWE